MEYFNKIRTFLQGIKTEILATVGITATALYFFGVIDQLQWEAILTVCGLGAYITLGARINRAKDLTIK